MDSKNLSIVLTDLKGYSARSASSSREEITELIKTHNDLLRPVIEFYKGKVVKTLGDAFLCVFDSATDASVCSIAIQMILQEFNRRQKDENMKLAIRVMINSGDVSVEDGDIYGEAVNLVSRMEKLDAFETGGIGISESTYLLMNRQEIVAVPLGEFSFEGISVKTKVFRIPLEKQKLTKLPSKLLDLVQQVSQGKAPVPVRAGGQWKNRVWIPATLGILVIAGVLVMKGRQGSRLSPRARRVLHLLRDADRVGDGTIYRKDFAGPKELFDSIDRSGDGVATPEEIMTWAESQGIELPPPGGPPPGGPPPGGRFPAKAPSSPP